ncbi:MAG: 50S ribosomal protein L23 [Sedimentisphaerales bacterium]|nr:50S ribosomal protein L23 [Sedimentisphaerales bacterium]
MDPYQIVIKPLITEQGTHLAEALRAYPFQVHPKANKVQIKQAVEKIYNVKVTDVRTANRKGKPRRRGRTRGITANWKKAVVVLHEDCRIDLF